MSGIQIIIIYSNSFFRLKSAEKIGKFLADLDKDLPAWAEVVEEALTHAELETHDGVKVVNTYFAPTLWFGNDATHPDPGAQMSLRPLTDAEKAKDEIAISCKFLKSKLRQIGFPT